MPNNGQVCIAPDYALVEASMADRFIAAMTRLQRCMATGTMPKWRRDRTSSTTIFQRVVGL